MLIMLAGRPLPAGCAVPAEAVASAGAYAGAYDGLETPVTNDGQLTSAYRPAVHAPGDHGAVLPAESIGALFTRVVTEVPDRDALVAGVADPAQRRRWTYRELAAEADRAARALLTRFEPGQHVAVWSVNRPEWVVLQLGAALAGLVLVTVNPALRRGELAYVLRQSRSAGVFYSEEQLGQRGGEVIGALRGDLPGLREAVGFGDWEDFLAGGLAGAALPEVRPGDTAQIQYTSGTTGDPKGCMLHHHGAIHSARGAAVHCGMPDGGVYVNPMPLFHVGSCVHGVLGALALRGTHVLMPGFDPALLLELIEAERASMTLVVPTMLSLLVEHPDAAARDLSSLSSFLIGGSACSAALSRRTTEVTGTPVVIGFGQTEAFGVVTQTLLTDSMEDQTTTIGQPVADMEGRIADLASNETVPVRTQGEICVRGPQTMTGYYDMPEATAAAIDSGGWLHTGDLGEMDARGYLKVTGRLKDMIIRGGENVYPREIEEIIADHPAVAGIQVVGIDDDKWGEQVGAVVVLRPGQEAGPAEIFGWAQDRLAPYKRPRKWYVVDEFPMTASGKVQKFVLRQDIHKGELPPAWVYE
jgi:fatty-acyl-CoA synthase